MNGDVRRKVLAPAPVWEAAQRIATLKNCTVNDLLLRGAERLFDDPAYAQSIRSQYRSMSLPLGTWPTDPIDCLVISWMLAVRNVTIDAQDDGIDPSDWWKDPPASSS